MKHGHRSSIGHITPVIDAVNMEDGRVSSLVGARTQCSNKIGPENETK